MTDDVLLVSLIKHSVMAESVAERRAARLLLDTLRNENGIASVRDELARLDSREAQRISDEANKLIARYDLK